MTHTCNFQSAPATRLQTSYTRLHLGFRLGLHGHHQKVACKAAAASHLRHSVQEISLAMLQGDMSESRPSAPSPGNTKDSLPLQNKNPLSSQAEPGQDMSMSTKSREHDESCTCAGTPFPAARMINPMVPGPACLCLVVSGCISNEAEIS